jgi:hypothetical protein
LKWTRYMQPSIAKEALVRWAPVREENLRLQA